MSSGSDELGGESPGCEKGRGVGSEEDRCGFHLDGYPFRSDGPGLLLFFATLHARAQDADFEEEAVGVQFFLQFGETSWAWVVGFVGDLDEDTLETVEGCG